MFWPPVRILNYAELAFAVSSPELGDTAFLAALGTSTAMALMT
jgi:hypothetical protein